MFRRILVAVDGSHVSDRALDVALGLVKDQQARLRIVHVVDTVPEAIGAYPVPDFDLYRQASLEAGSNVLDEAIAVAQRADVSAEPALVEMETSHPSIGVVKAAFRWSADLIVMGTHGRTGLMHLLLGSVAEGVVRDASVPVLLVRGTSGGAGESAGR